MDKEFPKRPQEHVLETKSSKYFERRLPDEWVYDKIRNDYGLDYKIDISVGGKMTGLNFSVQLKGKADISLKTEAKVKLKKSTLNYWNNRLEPTLVIIYCDKAKEAYWRWYDPEEFNLTLTQKTFTFKIEKSFKLKKVNWTNVIEEVNKIFQQRLQFSNLYKLSLNRLNNKIFQSVWKSYTNREFTNALLYCNEQIESNPKEILWYLIAAHCQYSLYRYKEALLNILNAEDLLATIEDIDLKNQISQIITNNKASIFGELGTQNNEIIFLLKAKELREGLFSLGEDSQLHYNYANTVFGLKDLDLAEKHYKISIERNPNNAYAWCNLAEIYFLKENFIQELHSYQTALLIDENLINACIGKGNCLIRSGKYEEGIHQLEKIEDRLDEIKLNYTDYYYWLSIGYEMKHDLEKALKLTKEGLRYNPANHKLITQQSKIYSKLWKIDNTYIQEALRFYEFRLKIYDDELRTIGEMVLMKSHLGEPNEKIANFISSHISIEGLNTPDEIVNAFMQAR